MASALRLAAFAVLAIAATIGTLVSSAPRREVFRAGPYVVLAGDFHVHSFPGDGGIPPWVMRDEARRAGLDVIAVTNHNQAITGRIAQWVSGRLGGGPIMIAGEEVTGADYHLIAVGVSTRVRADQPAEQAIDAIHAQGGVAIAAHPVHTFHGWTDEAMSRLDGAEVAHTIIWEGERWRQELLAFQARARQHQPRLSPVGSSDVHMTRTMGDCRTFLFVREVSEGAVLEALRQGMTVAMDMRGRLYGNPELVRMLADRRPEGRVESPAAARRASTGLAFAGLLGLIVFGRGRTGPAR